MSKFRVTSDFIVNSLCAVTIGTGMAEFCTNVFLHGSYVKYFKEAYSNGHPVQLSETLRKLQNDVIVDLKLTEFQKAFITPFTAEGFNPVNVGCINYRNGCMIGIPTIYDLNSIDDTSSVENLELKEYIHLLKDNSESGQKLMESLILSEPAKKYSIAREIILTDNVQVFLKSISWSTVSLPMYALGHTIINLLPANPFKIRVLAFFLLCNVGVFLCLLLRTAIGNYYQLQSDKILCNIGDEKYINGGIEYYEKLIQRNLALRNILPNGKEIYSENGDKIELISVLSEISLTYRKKFLENKLNQLINEKEKI